MPKAIVDGQEVDVEDVPVDESNERWTEVKLRDGTQFRVKLSILGVARVPGRYDDEGNPFYVLNGVPTVVLVNVPEALRRRRK